VSSVARFTTNWRVASTLSSVSFFLPWRSLTGAKHTDMGLAQMPVKKLNGARFVFPSGEIVDTQAMGRGWMSPIISA
jgi:hypothetical protein